MMEQLLSNPPTAKITLPKNARPYRLGSGTKLPQQRHPSLPAAAKRNVKVTKANPLRGKTVAYYRYEDLSFYKREQDQSFIRVINVIPAPRYQALLERLTALASPGKCYKADNAQLQKLLLIANHIVELQDNLSEWPHLTQRGASTYRPAEIVLYQEIPPGIPLKDPENHEIFTSKSSIENRLDGVDLKPFFGSPWTLRASFWNTMTRLLAEMSKGEPFWSPIHLMRKVTQAIHKRAELPDRPLEKWLYTTFNFLENQRQGDGRLAFTPEEYSVLKHVAKKQSMNLDHSQQRNHYFMQLFNLLCQIEQQYSQLQSENPSTPIKVGILHYPQKNRPEFLDITPIFPGGNETLACPVGPEQRARLNHLLKQTPEA